MADNDCQHEMMQKVTAIVPVPGNLLHAIEITYGHPYCIKCGETGKQIAENEALIKLLENINESSMFVDAISLFNIGNKIHRIRAVKTIFDCGTITAKMIVEDVWQDNGTGDLHPSFIHASIGRIWEHRKGNLDDIQH